MLLAHGELPDPRETCLALTPSAVGRVVELLSDGQEIKTVREALASVDQLRLDCLAALGLAGLKAQSRKKGKKRGSSSAAPRTRKSSSHDESVTAAELQIDTDEDDVPLAVRQRRLRRVCGEEGREGGSGSMLGGAEMPATPSESTDQGITIDLVRLSSSSTSDVSLPSGQYTEEEDGTNSGNVAIKEDLTSDSSGGIDLVREGSPPVIILDEAGHVQQTAGPCQCGLGGGVTATIGGSQIKDNHQPAGIVQGSRLGPKAGPSVTRIGLSGIGIKRKRKPSSVPRREDKAAPTYTPGQEAAWKAAAAAWRQRNAPSASEVSKAAAATAAAAANASAGRSMRTPAQRAAWSEAETIGGVDVPSRVPPRPTGEAPEADWRAYFRAKHHVRGKGMSFAALLTLYGSASEGSLRAQYHVAVRRYHPDSNSPDRVWRSDRQRLECEEIMKLINAQKPHSL